MTDTLLGHEALLRGLKDRIRSARIRSALAVNRELILLYWQIGREILTRQEAEKREPRSSNAPAPSSPIPTIPPSRTLPSEAEVNELVYALYNLNANEINIVEMRGK